MMDWKVVSWMPLASFPMQAALFQSLVPDVAVFSVGTLEINGSKTLCFLSGGIPADGSAELACE
jgi:hypothetical protein